MRYFLHRTASTFGVLSSRLRLSQGLRCCTRLLKFEHKRGCASHNYPQQLVQETELLIPLAERPASHHVLQKDLFSWYQRAQVQTNDTAKTFTEADDPSCNDLHRELDWLLDDAIALDWRVLKAGISDSSNETLALRTSFQDLQGLWASRIHERVPLQYLTNSAHWWELILAVGPGALIPRPETQCLLDFAAEAMSQNAGLSEGCWADLGTGSGALGLGLASRFPEIKQVYAIDQSRTACSWAAHNARRLALDHRLHVVQGSWFEPLQDMKGKLAGILSNPPYIEPQIYQTLQAEVRLHEPESALTGGTSDGIECLASICKTARQYLVPAGFIGLETGGPEQTIEVERMLAMVGFVCIARRTDMYGKERFVTAIAPGLG